MVEACEFKNIIMQQKCKNIIRQNEVRLVWYKSLEERILSKMLLFPCK